MKTTGLIKHLHQPIAALLAVLILLVCASSSYAQKIGARPLTHQEIHDYGLPEGTAPSGGLFTVGVGESVYLEVLVDKGTVVNSVQWSVAPVEYYDFGIADSSAGIMASPLPADMPIYSPGDREVFDAYGRALFVPDAQGKYTIQAIVTTAEGAETVQAAVIAANYVGIGTMGGATPRWPQCGACHEEQAVNYMATGHATFFERAVDGLASSHYSENCIDCHVLGGVEPDAVNGNFFNAADAAGWSFPAVLEPGNWDAMPASVQAMANVQCEHCHGAGNLHRGIEEGISVSLSSGDCGQCHDEEPYHNKNIEWNLSRHAVATRYPTGEGRGSCVPCHSGIGFIEEMDGIADKSTDYEAVVCAACHDPHSAENPAQVRTMADITLTTGFTVTEGGVGKLCVNCHQSRTAGVAAAGTEPSTISTRFGPHHGVQGDLFHGTNLIEYGKVSGRPSGHAYALENSCAGCHMQELASSDPAVQKAGGHTFKITWDNDTPDDASDDVDMVSGCVECHGPMDSFDDMKLADYNFDGKVHSVQAEIHELLETLAMKLPPVGEPTVAIDGKAVYTVAQKNAFWNYITVEEDASMGMHNPRYVAAALRASIEDLGDPFNAIFGGMNVPAGGEWFYSDWFEFYAPTQFEGWIYHVELGYLKPEMRDDGNIWLYDLLTQTWRYTTPELYPIMYVPAEGAWIYYGGLYNSSDRAFYNYATGKWSLSK